MNKTRSFIWRIGVGANRCQGPGGLGDDGLPGGEGGGAIVDEHPQVVRVRVPPYGVGRGDQGVLHHRGGLMWRGSFDETGRDLNPTSPPEGRGTPPNL